MKFYGIMYGDGDGYGVMSDVFFHKRENAVKYAKEHYGLNVLPGEPECRSDITWVGHTNECYVIECKFEDEELI